MATSLWSAGWWSMVRIVSVYVVLCVAPALAFYGFMLVLAGLDNGRAVRRLRRCLHRHRESARGPSIEQLAQDLRRLERELWLTERSGLAARAHRLEATSRAYDDILCACCVALSLPAPSLPLDPLGRLQVEADLSQQGLTW